MQWTTGQEDILKEYGSLGAKRCAEIIAEEFGITRTSTATQRHASRIGVSLFVFVTCVSCGRKVKQVDVSGLCKVCHVEFLAAQQHERAARLQREIEREEVKASEEFRETWKGYRAAQRKAERLTKKTRDRRKRTVHK